ncbi:glyoxalase [Ralstonia solanacearum]|uniref:glyoxalase n=1 Tax=Ralstonia solanacearum TaxID=305 RepID=UPI000453681F|nr:glyoxalase [Ralstonia solanacearum]EUJ15267.1 glyoxalase [Ralstonia solanacearum P673]MCL9845459.1 glyoxalase [Ralstonia solanacearum]MCL9849701.1 glyoxalase [Ralstonia solanacearum]MCL9856202.1 glyoxalase [Ralstonia solanacearum]MCL9860019.1 glyoxalase [Ralstonia solanacearum]
MTPDGDGAWTFDHVNFHVAGEPAILKFFADVLGWQPGHRPPFPFPGTWLYQGQDALVHLVATQGDAPELVFSHIAFRTTRDAADVLAKVRESGMPHRVQQHPERAAAQIFVQLPGAIVLELEARLSGPLGAARDET